MKKLIYVILAISVIVAMAVPAFAVGSAEQIEVIKTWVSGEKTLVEKTWTSDDGETITGLITKAPEVVTGVITRETEAASVSPYNDEVETYSECSDTFYIRIKNSSDVVVSSYKITLTGKVTAVSRKITDVSISKSYGTTCETKSEINGNSAYVIVTHPTLGYMDGTFTLNWDGTFSAS